MRTAFLTLLTAGVLAASPASAALIPDTEAIAMRIVAAIDQTMEAEAKTLTKDCEADKAFSALHDCTCFADTFLTGVADNPRARQQDLMDTATSRCMTPKGRADYETADCQQRIAKSYRTVEAAERDKFCGCVADELAALPGEMLEGRRRSTAIVQASNTCGLVKLITAAPRKRN